MNDQPATSVALSFAVVSSAIAVFGLTLYGLITGAARLPPEPAAIGLLFSLYTVFTALAFRSLEQTLGRRNVQPVALPVPVPHPAPVPGPVPIPPAPGPVPEPPKPGPGPAPDPPVPVPVPIPTPIPTPVPVGSDFDRCLAVTLREEGGNDEASGSVDRTSRGIEQIGDWDIWRKTHPGLPADVFGAPDDQIAAIYKQNYWNPLYCDSLPNGVDMVVFDHGVLAGIGTSARLLQTIVGTDVDGEIGPLTIAAAAAIDPVSLVGKFCDGRQAYYQGLYERNPARNAKYIHGWTNRVVAVRKNALALAAEAPRPNIAPPATLPPAANIPAPSVNPAWLQAMINITGTHEVDGDGDNATILGWATFIAKKFPDMASYAARYNHDSIAWCGLTVAYCMAAAGIRPQFGASDTDKFLWADSWRQFGVAVTTPRPGDVLVFKWADGGHHVTLYDHETDGDKYACRGGNQSDEVNVTEFPMESCTAIRRPA